MKGRRVKDYPVLLVEDDAGLCRLLASELDDMGLPACSVSSAEEALRLLENGQWELVVSDLRLPGMSGMELLRRIRETESPPAFLMVTAFGTVAEAVEALKEGADDFLTKPLNLEHFQHAVRRCLDYRRLQQEVGSARNLLRTRDFHGLHGRSRVMRELFERIAIIGRAEGPVLVFGETGTGKELVARAIHAESERRAGPFIAINCAGVPAELLESEFFGHKAGAFTGATRSRKGLFAEADGGTLFLDEIGEMPPALQAKMLRVLQEGTIKPVGHDREVTVNVRVVAATNRNLLDEVDAGRFRADLYYRLETFMLTVPPLCKREDDVEFLADYFLQQVGLRTGRRMRGIDRKAIELLRAYPFPGNVRELGNAIERAVTFAAESVLQPVDLPVRIREYKPARPKPLLTGPDESTPAIPMELTAGDGVLLTLAELESRYIRHVLERTGGNKRRAAAVLGIGRRTLYRKLEEEEQGQGDDPDAGEATSPSVGDDTAPV